MTRWFTFGQCHVHRVNGRTFDKDCVVEITDEAPRDVMIKSFGLEWSFEYDRLPDMKFFPKGVVKI